MFTGVRGFDPWPPSAVIVGNLEAPGEASEIQGMT